MPQTIYVAGPLFNSHERWYLEQLSAALEHEGYETFLPHRDAGILGDLNDISERRRLFRGDMEALDACDIVVALLTGADHDSGTCGELGYAYAKGKPCFGVTDDVRRINNLIWGLCGEGQAIARDIESVVAMVRNR
ncbi:MAG: nucleoside 2-deoxyribosyltransferase [Chloroflexi bacterium]|nr:nucleoside 2-deoxyribosyltransferase [Chloroflexota bacterium]